MKPMEHFAPNERAGAKVEQQFHERFVGFHFPITFSRAVVCEWLDDASGKYRIEVDASNQRLGKLLGREEKAAIR